jgi:hypothetical protein
MSARVVWVVAGLVCGACGQPAGPDPYVYVNARPKSSWPTSAPPVSFIDPTGMSVAGEAVNDGTFTERAPLPDGGSIDLFADLSSSPTARATEAWRVEDVQPGDHFDFVAPAQQLPDDCTSSNITGWTIDSGNATWTDPDAAHVVARIARYQRMSNTGMGYTGSQWTVVDGLTSTSVPDGDVLQELVTYHCLDETYDDVRTIVGVAGWE